MSDVLSLVGIFLTLAGLLGSFYAVHLANWYRELIQLEQKWRMNSAGSAAEDKKTRLECLYAIKGLHNGVVEWVSAVLSAFIVLVFLLSLILLRSQLCEGGLAPWFLLSVLVVFICIYLVLAAVFLWRGHKLGSVLSAQIETKVEKDVSG